MPSFSTKSLSAANSPNKITAHVWSKDSNKDSKDKNLTWGKIGGNVQANYWSSENKLKHKL